MQSDRDVLIELTEAVGRMRRTPVVDDDFPEMMFYSDRALGIAEEHLEATESEKPLPFFDRLRQQNIIRAKEWTGNNPTKDSLEYRGLELGGEAGECLNKIKHYLREINGFANANSETIAERIEAIADELGDIIICCDRVAQVLDINLEQCTAKKFNKTTDKMGFKTRM